MSQPSIISTILQIWHFSKSCKFPRAHRLSWKQCLGSSPTTKTTPSHQRPPMSHQQPWCLQQQTSYTWKNNKNTQLSVALSSLSMVWMLPASLHCQKKWLQYQNHKPRQKKKQVIHLVSAVWVAKGIVLQCGGVCLCRWSSYSVAALQLRRNNKNNK